MMEFRTNLPFPRTFCFTDLQKRDLFNVISKISVNLYIIENYTMILSTFFFFLRT